MGNRSWLKVILLLFLVSQITCKRRITTDDTQMIIHNAVITSEADLADVNFSNVDDLEFKDCEIRTLTVEMQAKMANVKILSITGGNVPTVQVATQFKKIYIEKANTRSLVINPKSNYDLEVFSVQNSKLEKVPENLSAMQKIRAFHFANNQIKTVDMANFKGLNNLEEISLGNNKITNINFSNVVLPKLENIYLYGNKLKEINMKQFTAPLLDRLQLDNNEFETIDVSQFNRFKNLRALVLSNNKITKISSNSVALPKLREFAIGSNRLEDISFANWNAPKMEMILIEGNQLKKAQALTSAFPALKTVWLFPNPFDGEWLIATLQALNARNVVVIDPSDHRYGR